jgi:peptide/nickel transport system permease protein
MSLPSFFVAILNAWIFAFVLADITGLNMVGSLYSVDDFGEGQYLDLKNLILPAFTLGIRPLAIVVQLTRSSLLEVLSQDYIRTARAKGLKNYTIIVRHALRNALNPVITAISGWFASLMAGAVFVEYVFDWKGIGVVIVDALEKYDFPVIMGAVLFISIILVVINILVDLVYGYLDPRIRYA